MRLQRVDTTEQLNWAAQERKKKKQRKIICENRFRSLAVQIGLPLCSVWVVITRI